MYKQNDEVVLTEKGREVLSDKSLSIFNGVPENIVAGFRNRASKFFVLEFDKEESNIVLLCLQFGDKPSMGIVQVPSNFVIKKCSEKEAGDFEVLTPDFWDNKKKRFVEIEDYDRANLCKKIQDLIKENI